MSYTSSTSHLLTKSKVPGQYFDWINLFMFLPQVSEEGTSLSARCLRVFGISSSTSLFHKCFYILLCGSRALQISCQYFWTSFSVTAPLFHTHKLYLTLSCFSLTRGCIESVTKPLGDFPRYINHLTRVKERAHKCRYSKLSGVLGGVPVLLRKVK